MKQTDDYVKLLSLLEEGAVNKTRDGYEFVEKRIPDSNAAGELDPRVLAVMQEQSAKWAAAEPPKLDPQDKFGFALFMRSIMGWDNTDVTRSVITRNELLIEGTYGSIPLRIYTPSGAQGLLPVVVFFHGGGFIGGTVGVVENPCKALVEKAGAIVVNVDYRLAPEHPFPAGLTDCFETVEWVYKHAEEIRADRSRITVAGDSAGGNLATVCALMDRDRGTGMIKYQALIYPTVNMARVVTDDFRWNLEEYAVNNHHDMIIPGLRRMAEGPNVLCEIYLQGKVESTAPYVSPLHADLTGMPETLIITAEFDGLRLEDVAYARKLTRSGVKTTLVQYNGTDHAFMDKIGQYPQAEDCMNEIAKGVRSMKG